MRRWPWRYSRTTRGIWGVWRPRKGIQKVTRPRERHGGEGQRGVPGPEAGQLPVSSLGEVEQADEPAGVNGQEGGAAVGIAAGTA